MKDKIQCYIRSIAVLLALTMLFSLVFACLYYFNVIQTKTFHILNWIGGAAAFASGGAVLGMYIEKKALLNALIIIVILAIPALLLGDHTLMGYIEVFSKLAAYMILCLFLFTRKRKS